MISKELLSAVFTDGQQDFKVIGISSEDERILEYVWIEELPSYDTDGYRTREVSMSINIYELAHKCKKWALEQGYQLESATNINGGYCHVFYSDCVPTEPLNETKTVSSETQAVFNDCEWILTNKET